MRDRDPNDETPAHPFSRYRHSAVCRTVFLMVIVIGYFGLRRLPIVHSAPTPEECRKLTDAYELARETLGPDADLLVPVERFYHLQHAGETWQQRLAQTLLGAGPATYAHTGLIFRYAMMSQRVMDLSPQFQALVISHESWHFRHFSSELSAYRFSLRHYDRMGRPEPVTYEDQLLSLTLDEWRYRIEVWQAGGDWPQPAWWHRVLYYLTLQHRVWNQLESSS